MPYKRRYRATKRFYKKCNGDKTFEKRVTAIVNKNIEKKSRVFELTTIDMNSTGFTGVNSFQDISRLDQGDQAWERIGNRVTPSYLQMNYQLTIGDTTNVVRMLIFQWMKDSSSVPTMADFFIPPISAVDNVYSTYVRNLRNVRVLHDRTYTLDNSRNLQVVGKVNLNLAKLMKKKVLYNNTSTDGKGHLFIVAFSDSLLVLHPAITYQAKFIYRDG